MSALCTFRHPSRSVHSVQKPLSWSRAETSLFLKLWHILPPIPKNVFGWIATQR
jgi:hypothetical protein